MPRSGIVSTRSEEGPVASIPVAAANQTAQLGTEPQTVLQTPSATNRQAETNPVQDTVTLSNGVPAPTPAEEAGLFQVAAPTIASFSPTALSGVTSGGAPKAAEGAVAALNAAPVTRVAPKTPVTANAPQGANAAATSAAQSAPATSTQSQNQLLQFTEYLKQLGLSPQAQSQMIDAARLLNDLDPPAFQQAIVALRAEAASLAAKAGSAPAQTANTTATQATTAATKPEQPTTSNSSAGTAGK